jgi:ankyrin repeat protein
MTANAPPSLHDLARAGDAPALAASLALPGASLSARVSARDHYSRTPLILAAWGGHADAVGVLLKAGAAPTAAAKGDQSALHFAAMRGSTEGHVEVAKALIDAGLRKETQGGWMVG